MATGEEDGDGGMVSEMHTVGGGGGLLYQCCLHRKRAAPPRSKDGGCANLIAAPPSLICNNPLMMYIYFLPFSPSLSFSFLKAAHFVLGFVLHIHGVPVHARVWFDQSELDGQVLCVLVASVDSSEEQGNVADKNRRKAFRQVGV